MKTALITGASRGIGNAIALHLMNEGYRVLGTATSSAGVSKLEEEFLQHVNSKCKNVLDELSKGILKDSSLKVLEDVAKRIANNYK